MKNAVIHIPGIVTAENIKNEKNDSYNKNIFLIIFLKRIKNSFPGHNLVFYSNIRIDF